MASLLFKRTILFVAFVFLWALLAGAVSHAATHQIVKFSGFKPGTIVIKTGERRLYYVIDRTHALRFPVGVGRKGKTWTGMAHVEGKYVKPSWEPPKEIRRDHPNLPKVIPGGADGNPMGVAALTLRGGDYAIHGTNNPRSIGGFVSYGCIRMYNSDIRALYRMVDIGTPVIVER
jgi:lipoprotein-anchoring transpeptidase ErfK/SrfK